LGGAFDKTTFEGQGYFIAALNTIDAYHIARSDILDWLSKSG
jgi:hypothetical protein